jgi:hypothetical protein
MAEEDEWTREEWEAYVRKQYKTLLAAKFSTIVEKRSLSVGAMSTVVTNNGNARGTLWCICDSSNYGIYSIKDNYINDVRYSLVGSSVRREAAILEVTSADSTDDTVVIEYEIGDLQINPSADYYNKEVQVLSADGEDTINTGVTYGTYAPCTYLKTNYPGDCNMSAAVEMPFCNASGLRESLCSSHYAAYVFPSTASDGSIVITTNPQCVRYSTTNTYDINKAYIVIGNPIVPDDPDDPDDPEEPIPPGEYREIAYLSLATDQVVLTDAYAVPGTTEVSCSFGIDFEGESSYSPELTYPIISCPVYYNWSSCDSNVYTYSTPSSIAVALAYSAYDIESNGILDITRPEGCNPAESQSTQYPGLAVQSDHTLHIALRSEADSSAVYLDGYSYYNQVLPGRIGAPGTGPIAIGGYGCGDGHQCHGTRKIYSAEVKGYAVVELQPVMTSDRREGLLNKTTGNIFYPMVGIGYGEGYAMDYIILNSNIGIAIGAQVKSGSRIAVTFNVPGNEPGVVPIMSIPGRVSGDEVKVHVCVRTLNTDSGTARGLEATVYNESKSTGQLIINRPFTVDDSMHNLVVDFSSGSVILDDTVISNSNAEQALTVLNWDPPTEATHRILIGESSRVSASGSNYLGVKLVEVHNAYGTDISHTTGLANELDVEYYLPAMNGNYVACLTQSSDANGFTAINPFYAVYSMPGYCRSDAGLYRLPGTSR